MKLVETFNEPAFDSKQQNVASLISEIVRVGRESLTNNSNVEAILTEIEKYSLSGIFDFLIKLTFLIFCSQNGNYNNIVELYVSMSNKAFDCQWIKINSRSPCLSYSSVCLSDLKIKFKN